MYCLYFQLWLTENPQLHPHVVNKLVTHVIFLDGGWGASTEEMSPNNRAGMQLQLQRSATCALMQEVCEQRVVYAPHDLMLTMRLWMAPPLFIVSCMSHVTHVAHQRLKDGKRREERETGNGGARGSRKWDLTSEELCW